VVLRIDKVIKENKDAIVSPLPRQRTTVFRVKDK
jgi:hypothetical protein